MINPCQQPVSQPYKLPETEGLTDEDLDALERQHWEATGVVSEALQKEEMFNYRAYARAAIAAALSRYGHPTPQPPAAGEVAELVDWLREHEAMAYTIEDIAEARRYARAAALLQHQQPVAVSEVAELVAWLRNGAVVFGTCSDWGPRLTRAAYLLQHQHPQPVAVSERLPEPSVKVLAHYFNALGKGRTICAIWVPAKSRSDEGDLDADDFLEYDEESDKYHWPEGWYEAIENWEELGWAKVYEGEIAYWQPLPQWPANALPLPSIEEGK